MNNELLFEFNGEGPLLNYDKDSAAEYMLYRTRMLNLLRVADEYILSDRILSEGVYKLGLDFHGVIDRSPEMLSEWATEMMACGNEIHIITGSQNTPEFRDELMKCGFYEGKQYNVLFSITDYHKEIDTEIHFDDNGFPFMPAAQWDPTKGIYAAREGLWAMWDDSPTYDRFFPFTTKYFKFSPERFKEDVLEAFNGRRAIGRKIEEKHNV